MTAKATTKRSKPLPLEKLAPLAERASMIVVPDPLIASCLARLLGLDPRTAADVACLSRDVSGRKRTDEACRRIAATLRVDEDRALTVLYTVQGIMRRADELEDAGPDDVFWYFGPVDGQMRPFCREHVGKVYRRATIAQLDNGQLPDPLLTGGGWECRHQFDVLSRFSELVELADTGRRVPEVAQALAALGTAPAVDSDLPPWSRQPKCPGPIGGRAWRREERP